MGRIVGQTLTLSLVYKIPYRRAHTWPSTSRCLLAERAREKRYLAYNPNPDLNPDFNPNLVCKISLLARALGLKAEQRYAKRVLR